MAENVVEGLSLKDQVKHILEEARVVLPGIQALFGFQFVAVFNQRFSQDLDASEQRLHLLALALTALAVVLSMAPAALHRQAEPQSVSSRLVKVCTIFITLGMLPLALGITLDFYLVSRMILHDPDLARNLAIALALVLIGVWYVLPHTMRRYLKH